MQIRGPSGESSGDVREAGDETLHPFLTPQHQSRSPSQSYFSVQNSQNGRKPKNYLSLQDSLDVFHDAFSTLQRPHSLTTNERKRHVSLGARAIENGDHFDSDCVEDSTETTGMLPKEPPALGRVRHGSGSILNSQNNRFRSATLTGSSPCHIGRLSLSTNSLRRKLDQDPLERHAAKKMGSPQKMGFLGGSFRSNGFPNYVPCAEMSELVEHNVSPEPEPVPVPQSEKTANGGTDAWMRNYVRSVEAERMLGLQEEEDTSRGEIQLCPGDIEQSKDTVMQMYSFTPVQRRRVGLQRVREEFKYENLRLEHKAPHLLVTSQWQQHNRMSCVYLGYRLFCAIYFSMWAIWAWVGSMGYNSDISQKKYFVLYMTNWGIWTLAVDTTLQAVNVILHFKKISEEGDTSYPSMPRRLQVSWVLSNITGALHIFITLAYWITVYPYRSDERLSEIGVNTHIMPGVYILLDTMVSATPRRLLHAYQPSLFLSVYTVFNLIYYLCGGTDYLGRPALYPVLDWTRPGITIGILSAVLLLAIPFLHAFICGLYAARLKIWRIMKLSRYVREDEMEQVEQGSQEQKV